MTDILTQEQLIAALAKIVGERFVIHRPGDLIAYECDGYTIERVPPRAVVLPKSTEEVARAVKLLHDARIPFIPRGAGTGLSGGAIPRGGEVIISLARMNRIVEIDIPNRRAVVEAGFVNLKLTHAVAQDGLYYAPDPSSQSSCTLGGNVAENSGGPHCLKYGVTTNHVLGVELVLPDGQVLQLGSPCGTAPYGAPGYDLAGLLIGSEGTMGIVTKVTVQLLPKPQGVQTILALFDRMEDASAAVSSIIAHGILPAALEMMDRVAIEAVEAGNYPAGYPKDIDAVLIVEVDGLEAGLAEQAGRIVEICRQHHVRTVQVAQNAEERARWWNNRKTAFGAMGKISPDYYVQDGVIPRSRLTEVLRQIAAIGEKHNLRIANVFHAGDGNLHPLIAYDRRIPGEVERVIQAGSEILAACVAVGGSISGEHGIGIEKQEDMKLVFSPADLEAQQAVRRVFDPDDLCNPGKLFPTPGRCAEMRRVPDVESASRLRYASASP